MIRDNNVYVNYTANTFQQVIDHNNPTTSATFTQRYWVDYSAWDGNGPALLYINGEAAAESSPTGFAAIYGHNISAVMFTLENRYYGGSMPSDLTNFSMLSEYLNVDIALEDLRSFMTFVESPKYLGRKLRWFIVGGSYSGALSAWFKQKYPSSVLAAWSSSGVVKAQFNFYDYDGHVGDMLPPTCRDSIENVLNIFSDMWDNETTRPALLAKFGVPSYFLKADMSYMLADAAAGAVQYGMKWALCDAIVPQSISDPLGQYNAMISDLWGDSFTSGCYYSTMCLSNRSMSQYWADAGYAWLWQTCSQMSYFQVGFSGGVRRTDVSTDYFVNQCRAAFTPTVFPDVYAFNAKYGGLTPDATNVIALQGSDDPWSTTGVRESLGPNYPAFIAECQDCGHCGDLMMPLASDPPSLVQQREQIVLYMNQWLSSQPSLYTLVLSGNVSFLSTANQSALTLMENAITLDVRASIDQSVIVTALTASSQDLTVTFQIEVNSLNQNIVAENIKTASNQSAWLTNTQSMFTSLGGTGAISVASIQSDNVNPTGSSSSACGPSCTVGILFGCVAAFIIGSLIVIRLTKEKPQPYSSFTERSPLTEELGQ
eukprot:CAMPEP_0176422864 /NCGR_PEP_ID=MMETSP0127-20121128/9968_1 /TAXON_ID=938130 /ORGANISM="Platyophrya macrostoma, Strain WH" /LENGTH=598 /DNA_ID=CAMNT_0017803757 /DNA_START=203 /DNA_END=1999 /DNA_ORIENTATION=+